MKILLRVGVLGIVGLLGWIAIAQAQRGSGEAVDESAAGNAVLSSQGATRPALAPANRNGNPLRGSTSAAKAPRPRASAPTSNRPAADPFGLQNRRSADEGKTPAFPDSVSAFPKASDAGLSDAPARNSAGSAFSREPDAASADQTAAGPSLTARDRVPSAADRVASRPDRKVKRSSDATIPPATSATQEPLPFKADPFALPANAAAAKTNRGGNALRGVSTAATENADGEGAGQPGDQQLEGVQSPQLTIQKTAPKEIQVGKPASVRVMVRNTGTVIASDVEVRDQIPKGTKLLGTAPQATRGTRGEVVWTLGTIRPGEESVVEMQLMPTAEGEIGSVATVHFGADASARSIATKPQLVVETTASNPKVLIGDQVTLTVTVSNPGTGVATGVVLEERIPAGLQHPSGAELEYEVGDLKPGESRKLELPLVAQKAGSSVNLIAARADGNLQAEHKLVMEVTAPQLDVAVEGPKKRFLERQATYQVSVSNAGTASARKVELIASLPAGLKFVSANNAGYYEESTRTVRWNLDELPANETGSVELVTMPVEAGQHAIKLRGTAQKGLVVEKEQSVSIEGVAAILFQVADSADPVEIGGETTYDIRVVNQGSKAATNVRLSAILPPELQPVAAEGPTHHELTDGNRVNFTALTSLAPKAEMTYRVRVKALKAGDLRACFQLLTDDLQSPVKKEESTRVYADE